MEIQGEFNVFKAIHQQIRGPPLRGVFEIGQAPSPKFQFFCSFFFVSNIQRKCRGERNDPPRERPVRVFGYFKNTCETSAHTSFFLKFADLCFFLLISIGEQTVLDRHCQVSSKVAKFQATILSFWICCFFSNIQGNFNGFQIDLPKVRSPPLPPAYRRSRPLIRVCTSKFQIYNYFRFSCFHMEIEGEFNMFKAIHEQIRSPPLRGVFEIGQAPSPNFEILIFLFFC